MIDAQNTRTRFNWEQVQREIKETRWSKLYASINPLGHIWLSKFTQDSLGGAEAYNLLYDRDRMVIGVQPANTAVAKNAFPAYIRKSQGGRVIHAARLIREYGIYVSATTWFPRSYIDHTGTLILDMKDTKPVRKEKLGRGEF